MKKLGILFAVLVMSVMFAVSASALEPTGQCGDNVYWEYDETTSELVISGEGEMWDYDSSETAPFCESEIKSIVFNDGIVSIGSNTFVDCDRLTNLMIDGSITKINSTAFCSCSKLKSVMIGDSVTTIGFQSFAYCYNLTNVTFGNSVTTIGDLAFQQCDALKDIFIPDNVMSIGRYAFSNCENLTKITVDINNQYYSSDEYGVLFNKDKSRILQYPLGNTKIKYTIPSGVTTIDDGAFQNCKNLADIEIPDSVTSIGCAVFSGTAYYNDFSNWDNGVLYIGKHLIEVNVTSSETFNVKKGTLTIATFAFKDTCNPVSVIIPDSIISIGYGVSRYFTKLTDVYYSGTMAQWLKIRIASDNYNLQSATIHYHYNNHSYKTVVTLPTCTEQGYTTYVCECGDTYVADYVKENGHSFTNYISDGKATCVTDGSLIAKCDFCDATDTKPEKGGHKFSDNFTIELDPTCTSEGQKSRHCLNCTEKTDITSIGRLAHAYNTITIEPNCTDRGHKIYTCSCGDSYTETIPAKGHSFVGSECTDCGFDKAATCSCNCHKSGFSGFMWKILCFFYKLFRTNGTCSCGAVHY